MREHQIANLSVLCLGLLLRTCVVLLCASMPLPHNVVIECLGLFVFAFVCCSLDFFGDPCWHSFAVESCPLLLFFVC